MRQLYKTIVVLMAILFTGIAGLKAQTSRWQQSKVIADSSQRAWLREQLKITDESVSRIFSIRDSMYMQVNRVRSDRSLTPASQDTSVALLRRMANEKIKETLGEDNFRLYAEAIKQRLQRSGRTGDPLTGSKN